MFQPSSIINYLIVILNIRLTRVTSLNFVHERSKDKIYITISLLMDKLSAEPFSVLPVMPLWVWWSMEVTHRPPEYNKFVG